MALLYKLCKRGHEQRPDNVMWAQVLSFKSKPIIQRKCKACHRLAQQRRYYRVTGRSSEVVLDVHHTPC